MGRFLSGFKPTTAKKPKTSEEKLTQQRKYERENRTRTYLPKWGNEFQWLNYEENKGMTCSVCSGYENSGTFVTGCKNYKRDTIMNHERSEAHKRYTERHNAKKNLSNTPAVKSLQKLNEKTIKQLVQKFRNVHFLGRKVRPYTDYPLLCALDVAKGLDVGTSYLSDKSAVQFSESIASAERHIIRSEVERAKFISGISDGSTDSSIQELEIVYVRYAHSGRIHVHFSLVKNIPKADAASIANVIMEGLQNLAGDGFRKKLVATGTDEASTMLGLKSGAVQRLREATGKPWLVGVHYNGHKLELAYKDALKSGIKLYSKIDAFLLNLYYFYRNSNLTRAGLKDSYKVLNQRVLLPTRVGGTRWIGHLLKAIEHFIRDYEAIRQHLQQLQNRDLPVSRTEKGNKAKHFYSVASSRDVWLMMHFQLDVLCILVDISKKFQSKTATISEVMDEIRFGVKNLNKLKASDGSNLRKAKESEPSDLIGNEVAFKSARVKLIDALAEALQRRFMDNYEILEACSVVNLSKFPTSDEDLTGYGDVDVATLVDYFRDGLHDAGVEIDKCETEWTKLKDQIPKRFSETNSTTWEQVNETLGKLCPNFLSLVDLILTIPASSADAERGFNRMKITKSDWRSKLNDSNLSDQMMIMLESCDIATFDPMPAISLWMSGTTRRLRQEKETKSTVADATGNPVVQEAPALVQEGVVDDVNPVVQEEVVDHDVNPVVQEEVVELDVNQVVQEVVDETVVKLPDVQLTNEPSTAPQPKQMTASATMTDIVPVPHPKQMSTSATMTDPLPYKYHPIETKTDEAYESDEDYVDEEQDSDSDMTLKGRLQSASDAWHNFCDLFELRAY